MDRILLNINMKLYYILVKGLDLIKHKLFDALENQTHPIKSKVKSGHKLLGFEGTIIKYIIVVVVNYNNNNLKI